MSPTFKRSSFSQVPAMYFVCFKMDIRQAIWKLIKSHCNAQDDCGVCRCSLQNHHTFDAIWGSCDYSSSTCRSTVTKQPVPVLTLTEKFLEDKALNAQEAVLVLLGLDTGQLITPRRNDECTSTLAKYVVERPIIAFKVKNGFHSLSAGTPAFFELQTHTDHWIRRGRWAKI